MAASWRAFARFPRTCAAFCRRAPAAALVGGAGAAVAVRWASPPCAITVAAEEAANVDNYRGVFDGGLGFGKKAAVIVIDFTYAYTTPGSALHCPGKGFGVVDAVQASKPLLELARQKSVPIFYTKVVYHHPTDGGLFAQKIPLLKTFTEDNPLVQIDKEVQPQPGDAVLVKQYPSAFYGTHLASSLRGIDVDTCIIIGCSTSGCIRASVLEGMCLGFRCIVPRECVGDRTASVHEANLFDINAKNGDVVAKSVVMDYLGSL